MITLKTNDKTGPIKINHENMDKFNKVHDFVLMPDNTMVVKISDGKGSCRWIDSRQIEVNV